MSKGEQTHQMILERAVRVFNQQGYFGASLADLMRATGLKKGGIYNHFHSKEELAVEAFEYAVKLVWERIQQEYAGKRHAIERLIAMMEGYRALIDDPPVTGGCPLLNTAIESDDAQPELRQHARDAMTRWRAWIVRTLERGIAAGEVRPDIDGDALATIIITTLEGGVMLSKLYDDPIHIRRVVDHLSAYLKATLPV